MDSQEDKKGGPLDPSHFSKIAASIEERESPKGFLRRVEEIAASFKSKTALASAAGIAPSSLQGYMAGSEPTRPALIALARAARVSVEWLATGRGPKQEGGLPEGHVAVPFYDLRKAGGRIYPILMAEISRHLILPEAWLSAPGRRLGRLFVVEALDDSMAPVFENRDMLVVHLDPDERPRFKGLPYGGTAEEKFINRALYLIAREARASVRRLEWKRPGETLLIKTVAEKVDKTLTEKIEESITPTPHEVIAFVVLGRVIWAGGPIAAH